MDQLRNYPFTLLRPMKKEGMVRAQRINPKIIWIDFQNLNLRGLEHENLQIDHHGSSFKGK